MAQNRKALPLLLFAAAGASFYMAYSPEDRNVASSRPPLHLEYVEQNMKTTEIQKQIEKQKIYHDNLKTAPSLNSSRSSLSNSKNNNLGVDMTPDFNAEAVADRLQDQKKYPNYNRYDYRVQEEIYVQEQNAEASAAAREEYARKFVENAARGGYAVQLSEDYKIISVKPLRKPNSNSASSVFDLSEKSSNSPGVK